MRGTLAIDDNAVQSSNTVLFLHGNSMSSKIWKHQLKSDALRNYRSVTFDLPGHGESSDQNSFSLQTLVDALGTVITELKLNDFILIGHSLGGNVILQALRQLPGCKGIVLVSTTPFGKPPALAEMLLPDTPVGLFFSRDTEPAHVSMLSGYIFENKAPDFFEKDFMRTDGRVREMIATAAATMNYEDETELLRMTGLPVGVIVADGEKLQNNNYCRSLQMPTLWKQTIAIPQSGHCPQWENPAEFDRTIAEFCNAVYTNPLVTA